MVSRIKLFVAASAERERHGIAQGGAVARMVPCRDNGAMMH
jgi:hypothetical protein